MSFFDDCTEVMEKYPRIAKDLYFIRTQDQGFQRLTANQVQLHYHQDRCFRGFNSRDIILKARRHGFSTWKILEALTLAIFVEGFAAAIVVHEQEAAGRIFKILRWAYDRLPEEIKRAKPLDEDRRDALEVGGSTVYVYTAGGRGVGRSETIHFAHLSEVAWWPDPEEVLAGIDNAVPLRTGHVCMESTPNGRENFYYDACNAARFGESPYKLYFYPWWWSQEVNSIDLIEGERIFPDEEEQRLIQLAAKDGYTLTPENLKWRRQKLSDPASGPKFLQEQPEDPETCFLVSGGSLFDPMLIRRLVQESEAMRPIEQLWLPGNGDKRVWKKPIDKYPYITAVDVAEGKAHGDWSVISTWQLAPQGLINVSRTRLRVPSDDLVPLIKDEAEKYHGATVIVENNSIGGLVTKKLWDAGYYNQYLQLDRDKLETDHLGWRTTPASKKEMVQEFVAYVNAGDVISYDVELWGQAQSVTTDEYGRPVFPKKRHDDIFAAACIANMGRDQARKRSKTGAVVTSYI